MTKKEKRDLQINQEKEYLLDPEYVAAKKKKRKKKLALTIVIELIAVAALIVAAFQIVRAVGKKSLTSKAEEAAPDLNLVRASETLTEEEETKWQEGWVKYNGSIYAYNEDVRTFLFMGIDKKSDVKEVEEGTKGGQADAQRAGSLQTGRAGKHARLCAELIIAQRCPVTNKKQRFFAICNKIRQRVHRLGGVRGQAGVGGQIKGGPVYLTAARIQRTQHSALSLLGQGQGFQRGDPGTGGVVHKGQPLHSGQADAQAGKAARPGAHAVQVQVGRGQAGGLERTVHQAHQGLAVGQPAVHKALIKQLAVFGQGHACGAAGCINAHTNQKVTPSMVIFRSSPPRC